MSFILSQSTLSRRFSLPGFYAPPTLSFQTNFTKIAHSFKYLTICRVNPENPCFSQKFKASSFFKDTCNSM